jgi:hypothetical protein
MAFKNYPIILCSDQPSEARSYRVYRANQQYAEAESGQTKNADDTLEVDRSGTLYKTAVFSKTMPHNSRGEVEKAHYDSMVSAIEAGTEAAFASVPQGDARKFVNPRATQTFSTDGLDHFGVTMPPAPLMTSAEAGAEMIEVYEHALNRDSTFDLLESVTADTDADRAVANLNAFGADFKGPKEGGVVTRKSLFRGVAEGCLLGHYISQFLYQDIPYGDCLMEQKYNEETGTPHGTTMANFLDIQNGVVFDDSADLSGTYKYIHTPRVLSSYVHRDAVFQSFLNAALILKGAGAPVDASNPLVSNAREEAFVTHGVAECLHAVTSVARVALKTAWVQKWHWHRRLRPEVMACRVHHQVIADTDYSLDATMMASSTLTAVKAFNASGLALLPLQYPEGSPAHPSYPAGHSTFAGACATVLKALFEGTTDVTTLMTVQHSTDGVALAAYGGSTAGMTVNTELNKLAANIAIGRDWAGVHYRSDGDLGLDLGEKVAIAFLKDLAGSYVREDANFAGFTLRKFDGTVTTIK